MIISLALSHLITVFTLDDLHISFFQTYSEYFTQINLNNKLTLATKINGYKTLNNEKWRK